MNDQAGTAAMKSILHAVPVDRVFDEVCARLAPFNRGNVVMARATDISADLEVDSIAVFDVIMEIEDAYEIVFPMEMVAEMKTIGELVDTIRGLQAG